jgi:hypothetical protein
VVLTGRSRHVALEILTYLVKHPQAKDSVAGIRQWWFDEAYKWSEKDVCRATEELVMRGLMCIWKSTPGPEVLGPTREFLQTPGTFLREFENDRADSEN